MEVIVASVVDCGQQSELCRQQAQSSFCRSSSGPYVHGAVGSRRSLPAALS